MITVDFGNGKNAVEFNTKKPVINTISRITNKSIDVDFNKNAIMGRNTKTIGASFGKMVVDFPPKSIMPMIRKVIFNEPATIVYWIDGTKTVVKCISNDDFNPEIGLAMAISKKYYESIGFSNPRSAFKREVALGDDQTNHTKEKKLKKLTNDKKEID